MLLWSFENQYFDIPTITSFWLNKARAPEKCDQNTSFCSEEFCLRGCWHQCNLQLHNVELEEVRIDFHFTQSCLLNWRKKKKLSLHLATVGRCLGLWALLKLGLYLTASPSPNFTHQSTPETSRVFYSAANLWMYLCEKSTCSPKRRPWWCCWFPLQWGGHSNKRGKRLQLENLMTDVRLVAQQEDLRSEFLRRVLHRWH